MNGVEVFIPLTKGFVAIVDVEDWDKVRGYPWKAKLYKGVPYAARSQYSPQKHVAGRQGDGNVTISMHKSILPGQHDVDHWDRNTLDNRRHNLRPASRSQNCANQKIRSTNTSGFKGVNWKQWGNCGAWCARISVDYKRIHLGYFSTAEEAAHAYDTAAQHHFGEFARLNFPNS